MYEINELLKTIKNVYNYMIIKCVDIEHCKKGPTSWMHGE